MGENCVEGGETEGAGGGAGGGLIFEMKRLKKPSKGCKKKKDKKANQKIDDGWGFAKRKKKGVQVLVDHEAETSKECKMSIGKREHAKLKESRGPKKKEYGGYTETKEAQEVPHINRPEDMGTLKSAKKKKTAFNGKG